MEKTMTDKSQPLSGATPPAPQKCIYCGDPYDVSAWPRLCVGNPHKDKVHVYRPAAPVAVPAGPRQKVEPSQGWSIRLGIDDTWEGHAPYWFFDVLKGDSIEGCGSADDLPTALSMAAELYGDIFK